MATRSAATRARTPPCELDASRGGWFYFTATAATATARARSTPTPRSERQSTWPVPAAAERLRRDLLGAPASPEEHARASSLRLRQHFVSVSPAGRCWHFLDLRASSMPAGNFAALRPDLAHLEPGTPESCRLVRRKPPAQSPPSPLIWDWLSKQVPGFRVQHSARVTTLGAGLDICPGDTL